MMDYKTQKFITTTQAPISINGEDIGAVTILQDPDENGAIVRLDISTFEGELSREKRNMVDWHNMSAENSRLKKENEQLKAELEATKEERYELTGRSMADRIRLYSQKSEVLMEKIRLKGELEAVKEELKVTKASMQERIDLLVLELEKHDCLVSSIKDNIDNIEDVWARARTCI